MKIEKQLKKISTTVEDQQNLYASRKANWKIKKIQGTSTRNQRERIS